MSGFHLVDDLRILANMQVIVPRGFHYILPIHRVLQVVIMVYVEDATFSRNSSHVGVYGCKSIKKKGLNADNKVYFEDTEV